MFLNFNDNLNKIIEIVIIVNIEMNCIFFFPSIKALMYIRSLPKTPKIPFSQLYPKATPLGK